MYFHSRRILISFITKVPGLYEATAGANDTNYFALFLFCFSCFIQDNRAEISHMNRRQNLSRKPSQHGQPGSYEEALIMPSVTKCKGDWNVPHETSS